MDIILVLDNQEVSLELLSQGQILVALFLAPFIYYLMLHPSPDEVLHPFT